MMFDDEHVPLLKKNFMDMRQLNHPNIVKYKALYIDLERHLAHLIMEFVNLTSLMDYISSLAHPVQENVLIVLSFSKSSGSLSSYLLHLNICTKKGLVTETLSPIISWSM